MKPFLDTNILVYAQQQGAKGDVARGLLAAGGVVSVQVLNEFAAVARRKLGRPWGEIRDALEDILAIVDEPLPITPDLHRAALGIAAEHGLSVYDALVVAAAIEANVSVLLSEDMQSGRRFGGLLVANPFEAG